MGHNAWRPILLLGLFIGYVIWPGICSGSEYRISKLHYTNSEGEIATTTYVYDHLGQAYKAVWELEDGSRYSINRHEFNGMGQIILKSRFFSDSLTSVQEYVYGNENQLVHETFSRSDGVSGHATYFWSGPVLDSARCQGLNG